MVSTWLVALSVQSRPLQVRSKRFILAKYIVLKVNWVLFIPWAWCIHVQCPAVVQCVEHQLEGCSLTSALLCLFQTGTLQSVGEERVKCVWVSFHNCSFAYWVAKAVVQRVWLIYIILFFISSVVISYPRLKLVNKFGNSLPPLYAQLDWPWWQNCLLGPHHNPLLL